MAIFRLKYINAYISVLALIISSICVYFTHSVLSKDKEIEILYIQIKDRRALFEEASLLINTRFRNMKNIIDKLSEIKSSNNITQSYLQKLDILYDKYRNSIDDYNINVRKISKQLRYVFDEEIADMFSKEKDNDKNPVGIACRFQIIHDLIRDTKNSIKSKSNINYLYRINQIKNQEEEIITIMIKFMDILAKKCFDKEDVRQYINY